MTDFETIVIGAGGMGAAAAYHLARGGHKVALIEQFEIGHNRGASHGESRIIRLSYGHPDYVRLSRVAYSLWADIEAEAGERVLLKTGGLDLSKRGNAAFEACITSMDEVGVDYEILDAKEVRNRFPQFQIGNEITGVFQKDAGILSPGQVVPMLARLAETHGCALIERSPVIAIEMDKTSVTVHAGNSVYTAKKLALSPGPWATAVAAQVGVTLPLTVTQENYAFFQTGSPDLFMPGSFPIFAQYGTNRNGEDIEFYGFPTFGRDGVKVAEHHFGPVVTADDRSFAVPTEAVERLRSRAKRLIPGACGELLHAATCLYSCTTDRHFVIDTVADSPKVVMAAGFSGHGFKFAIAVGKMIADLIERGSTDMPRDLFRLGRFGHLDRAASKPS